MGSQNGACSMKASWSVMSCTSDGELVRTRPSLNKWPNGCQLVKEQCRRELNHQHYIKLKTTDWPVLHRWAGTVGISLPAGSMRPPCVLLRMRWPQTG